MKTTFPDDRENLRLPPLAAAFALALAAMTDFTQAQDGYYDASWGGGGRLMVDVGASHDNGLTLAIQPDGKLVLGGSCQGGSAFAICAVRLNPDGQLDLAFGTSENGRILFGDYPGLSESYLGEQGLALQADGRILLVGNIPAAIGVLIRLNMAGHLEPASAGTSYTPIRFSVHSSVPRNSVNAVVVTPNGKIIVAGETFRAGSNPPNLDIGIARFHADRTPDTGFGTNGIRLVAFDLAASGQDTAADVAVQSDNKIVVVGAARDADGRLEAAVLRLGADGTPDAGFGNGGRVWFDMPSIAGDIVIEAVAIDRQGRIVVAGTKEISDTSNHDFMVARLDGQGQLDNGFGVNGIARIPFDVVGGSLSDRAYDLALQSDGRILVAGTAANDSSASLLFAVARLTADGQLDPSFGIDGKGLGTFAPPEQTTENFDSGHAIVIGNGGFMVAGTGIAQENDARVGISKIQLDLVFTDGFQ